MKKLNNLLKTKHVTKLKTGEYYQVAVRNNYVGCYPTLAEAVEAADYFVLNVYGVNSKWKLHNPNLVPYDAVFVCDICKNNKTQTELSIPKSSTYSKLLCLNCTEEKRQAKYQKVKERLNGRRPSVEYRKTLLGYLSFLVSCARQRVKNRTYDCSLTKEDLVTLYEKQAGQCALSGKTMTWGSGSGRVLTNISLDRIDSSLGYTIDNVQLVCDFTNNMKSILSNEELIEWCQSIVSTQEHKVKIDEKESLR